MSTTLRVQVDEITLDKLQMIGDHLRRPIEEVAALRLKAAVTLLPSGGARILVVAEALDTLETILGGGSILHEGDLCKKVERLAGVSFLHVRLPFTPNQLETLAERAERQGLTVDQLVERTAPRIYEQFFNLIETSR